LTFGYTGSEQTWTVPAGVTQATFAVWGAQGGKSGFNGGLGGFALATLALTPGQVVAIRVGSQVQIVGHGFDPAANGTTVTFGGVGASVQSCTATTCTATVPPGSGTVPVRVSAFGEQSLDTPADDFTYLPPPSLASISPTSAPPGASVTITGQGFVTSAGFTSIQFGNSSAQATCTSSTQCTAIVPGDEVGSVPVVVQTYGGKTGSLSFLILPSVTVVSPPGGPLAGGTVVTITGSGFDTVAGGTAISFGSTPAVAVGCASAGTCTAVSPPGTGTVDVRVTAHGGESPTGPAARFTYRAAIGEEPTSPTTTTAPPTTSTTVVGSTYAQPTTAGTSVTPAFTG
jgi:hypothetical protein